MVSGRYHLRVVSAFFDGSVMFLARQQLWRDN